MSKEQPEQVEHRHRYTAAMANELEPRWQAEWDRANVFVTPNPGQPGFDASRPKFYCLDMFPYPSGAGLHVGHPEGYTATDIVCRYKRMKGFNVLHPMGYDAFGLPAEQYAIQTGVHPAITTKNSIENFRRQLKRFGFSYDWSREFATIDPDYYKWTQWIFLRLYNAWVDPETGKARPIAELKDRMAKGSLPGSPAATANDAEKRAFVDSHRLAYVAETTVNWCPKLGTVLANDEVIDGRSERGGYPVVRKPLKQWMFRITAMAERLLRDLDRIDWPASTKTMQSEWIGRSEGAEVDFPVLNSTLRVFTTRPDTIFGATYMVVAPEHPLVDATLAKPGPRTDAAKVRAYATAARNRSDIERMEGKEKTGVDLGIDAINPATGKPIPIWVADYVLMGYGTGAIMAVPAHDERDFDFARAFGLPIVQVLSMPGGKPWDGKAAFTADSSGVNSKNAEVSLDGLTTPDAKKAIIEWLERTGRGVRKINYKLRDWTFSRQRYWGEPFPIVYDQAGNHYPVGDKALPVVLPELADYAPIESDDPAPLLAKATEWANTTAGAAGVDPAVLPPNTPVRRECNTMPGSAGSSWYFLRYCDARNAERFVGSDAEKYWMVSARNRTTGVPPVSPQSGEQPSRSTGPELLKSRRNLPHWEKGGSTYFVTFSTSQGMMTDAERRIVLDACTHWHRKRAIIQLACVMPDHVHIILTPLPDSESTWFRLSDILHSIKSFSAHELNKQRRTTGPFWLEESFDRLIRDEDEYRDVWNYVLANPIKEKLVERAWAYPFLESPAFVEEFGGRPPVDYGDPLIAQSSQLTRPAGDHRRDACGPAEKTSESCNWREDTHHFGGVDLYMGGAEHAVGHLLYARFWHKVLFDLGEVSTPEPFGRLYHQGLITSFSYQRADKSLAPNDQVEEVSDGVYIEKATGKPVTPVVAKMSKSLKNVVNPDDVIAEFGADTFRLYEMYMGPLDASKPWNPRDIVGMFRFLQKLWRAAVDEDTGKTRLADAADEKVERRLHRVIAKVGQDIEHLGFNTAIAAMIELVNMVTPPAAYTRSQLERLTIVLSPFAPHLAQELWARLGNSGFVCRQAWPTHDESMLTDSELELPVQVNGKLRGKVMVPAGADAKAVEAIALADGKVAAAIEGKSVKKVIVVPGRMVNIIAG